MTSRVHPINKIEVVMQRPEQRASASNSSSPDVSVSEGPWTRFMDMHSGGGQKEAFAYLYIEAPLEEAKAVFYHRYDHNPERVTCSCCGGDYSIAEHPTLREATAYDRGCDYDRDGGYVERARKLYGNGRHVPLEEFVAQRAAVNGSFSGETIEFIYASDIKPEERQADMPEQGWVWKS